MRSMFLTIPILTIILTSSASALVEIEWVTVGDPNNACETHQIITGCFGSVAAPYRIGKFEVTNSQYAEFLNAIAASDPNALYNTQMAVSGIGGITQGGTDGSFTYSAKPGHENRPVNYVSFFDVLRFSNWLHNGQPTGAQDNTTTEDGAYSMTPAAIAAKEVPRNADATVFIPTEDQWYKAAYYDVDAMIYYDYPTGSDTAPACTTPGPTPNTSNCGSNTGLQDAGSYSASPSPNGTFDQGGNICEWTDDVATPNSFPRLRFLRGGCIQGFQDHLRADRRNSRFPAADDTFGFFGEGFRVASTIPPRSVPSLSSVGLLLLAGSSALIGLAWIARGARDGLRATAE